MNYSNKTFAPEITSTTLLPSILMSFIPCRTARGRGSRRLGNNLPNNNHARRALLFARHTFELLTSSRAAYHVVENPATGFMPRLFPNVFCIVDQCQYGLHHKKPTALWGRLQPSFKPKRCEDQIACGHVKASGNFNYDGNERDPYWNTHTPEMGNESEGSHTLWSFS
jgi:hypothetical protein